MAPKIKIFMKMYWIFIALSYTFPVFSLEIWNKYGDIQNLTAQFKQKKIIKSLEMTLFSEGSLTLKRPDFFEWNIVTPSLFTFTFSKDKIEIKEGQKISKTFHKNQMDDKILESIFHLKGWLMLDETFIKSHYSIKQLSPLQYEFTPLGEKKIFKNIVLTTDKNIPITQIKIIEFSDDVINIEFFNTKINPSSK